MPRLLAACAAILALLGSCAETQEGPPEKPNILFAIADDASFPHMGAYGTEWVNTPNFDRVARDGVLFWNAYTPNAKCAPSRAAILTGRNSWQLEAGANHMAFFPPEFKSYPEALGENGYFVGMTAKGWSPGIAVDAAGNARNLAGTPFDDRESDPPTSKMSRTDYAANFADFLATAPAGQPWAFWYGSREPHRAYEFRSGAELGGKSPADIEGVFDFWPDTETVRHDMLDYAYEIEYFDAHLGRILETLEEHGQLANTLVIVTSDNGMPFPRVKAQEYELSNHLPLAMMWLDGIPHPGRSIQDLVSFVDLAPTIVDAAGIAWDATGMQPAAGRSLLGVLRSDKEGRVEADRDHVLIGKERHDIGRPNDAGYPIRGIVQGDLLYLRNFAPERWPAGNPETGYLAVDASPTKTEILDLRRAGGETRFWELAFGKRGAEELYNIAEDPGCLNNLAGDLEYAPAKAELAARLVSELEAQGDPRMAGQEDYFEAFPVATRWAGYYEKFMAGEVDLATWILRSDIDPAMD
ncbi:MAG: sulfatase [Bryobacterales bacterium]|nr:sulfatase [Bryobacterales bacterium]